MNLKKAFSILISIILLFGTSCKQGAFYSSSVEFEDKVWDIDENALFSFEVIEPQAKYAIFIDFVCSKQYLTDNIWFEFAVKSPGNIEQIDTVMFLITDEGGKWFGNEKSALVENKFLYKNNISFPQAGEYTVKIRHLMRENDLPQAVSTGITIEKYK